MNCFLILFSFGIYAIVPVFIQSMNLLHKNGLSQEKMLVFANPTCGLASPIISTCMFLLNVGYQND